MVWIVNIDTFWTVADNPLEYVEQDIEDNTLEENDADLFPEENLKTGKCYFDSVFPDLSTPSILSSVTGKLYSNRLTKRLV